MNYAITPQENTTTTIQAATDCFFEILLHGMTDYEKKAARKRLALLWKEDREPKTENRKPNRK